MCGIAGVVTFDEQRVSSLDWKTAFRRLEHRGPDGRGFLAFGREAGVPATLGEIAPTATGLLLHTRLSILDLSAAGAQPMASPDRRFWVIFNGEIYNFLEIRDELVRAGHAFHTGSDTEVILASFAEWGDAAVTRFVGMFALALLDREARTLRLFRDPFGIKPLYYFHDPSRVAFASEMKALYPLTGKPKTVDPERLYQYLRFGQTDNTADTLIEGIQQLPPGSMLEVSLDEGPRPTKSFWTLKEETADVSFEEATQTVRDLFLRNVELHLRSDVQVGACLSGGIDSSAIVSAMRYLKGRSLELHTFTYVAEGGLSEERWADRVSESNGTVRHKIRASAEELAAELDAMILAQDEPFVSTSMYAQYRVFRLIGENKVKVVLDGQGSDEMFAGYRPYLGTRIASLIRQGRINEARHLWNTLAQAPGCEDLKYFVGQNLLPAALQDISRSMIGKEVAPPWLNAAWFREQGVVLASNHAVHSHKLRDQLADSLKTGLRALLRYEDRNSMAYSIESRVPFLTPALAEYVLSLPESYLISQDGVSKSVLREAMRGIVPDDVLDRKDKVAFVTPERDWLVRLRPWVEQTLNSELARSLPIFDHAAMMREWEKVCSGAGRYNMWTWRWINLIRWASLNDVRFS